MMPFTCLAVPSDQIMSQYCTISVISYFESISIPITNYVVALSSPNIDKYFFTETRFNLSQIAIVWKRSSVPPSSWFDAAPLTLGMTSVSRCSEDIESNGMSIRRISCSQCSVRLIQLYGCRCISVSPAAAAAVADNGRHQQHGLGWTIPIAAGRLSVQTAAFDYDRLFDRTRCSLAEHGRSILATRYWYRLVRLQEGRRLVLVYRYEASGVLLQSFCPSLVGQYVRIATLYRGFQRRWVMLYVFSSYVISDLVISRTVAE